MRWSRWPAAITLTCMFWTFSGFAVAEEAQRRLAIPLSSEAAAWLQTITLLNPDGDRFDADTLVRAGTTDPVVIDLGIGDYPHKAVTLAPHSSDTVYRVAQQFETSLTLMNEGPHLDLLDWRHHVSPWMELPSADGLTFQAIEIASESFPAVSREEIVAAVNEERRRSARQGYDPGDKWTKLAEHCASPTTYPCGVSVSKVRLRVQVAAQGGWRTLQLIEIVIPMGC